MTEIRFIRNSDHKFTGFTCTGHAEFDEKGKDLVCCAISILTINAINSIEKVAKKDAEVIDDEEMGYLSIRLKEDPDERTETIFRSLILGLKEIRAEYGRKYLKVIEKEEEQC